MTEKARTSFRDIVGQETACEVLLSALRGGRVPHAYLFVGPEGVGKRTAALQWAKILNCSNPVSHAVRDCGCSIHDPCNTAGPHAPSAGTQNGQRGNSFQKFGNVRRYRSGKYGKPRPFWRSALTRQQVPASTGE